MGAFGILMGIIGGIIGLLAGGIGLTVGGIMMLIHSLVFQLASPPTAVACVGGALMMTAVGILLLLAFIWLIFGAFPAVFRWAVDLIQRVLHRGIREVKIHEKVYKNYFDHSSGHADHRRDPYGRGNSFRGISKGISEWAGKRNRK